MERPQIGGAEVVRLRQRLHGGDGGLQLLVHRAGHGLGGLPHDALGGGKLQTGVLPDDERGETQDWHERHEHERHEMATKSHGPREAAPG